VDHLPSSFIVFYRAESSTLSSLRFYYGKQGRTPNTKQLRGATASTYNSIAYSVGRE